MLELENELPCVALRSPNFSQTKYSRTGVRSPTSPSPGTPRSLSPLSRQICTPPPILPDSRGLFGSPVQPRSPNVSGNPADNKFRRMFEDWDRNEQDIYDIIVTDGIIKDKVLLHTHYNRLVRTSKLKENSCIGIYKYAVRTISSPHTGRKEKIHIINKISTIFDDEDTLVCDESSLEWLYPSIQQFIPLAAHRKCYFSLRNDDFLREDPRWNVDITMDNDFRLPLTYPTIHNVIVTNHGTFPPISTYSKQPMVGRVISKTSMQNFSRPTDYRIEYPWKFSFEIQDCSHKLTVTVWNEKALEIFNSVKVGCLVWLNDYCLKRIMTKDRRIAGKGVEVAINPRDPEGDVRILGDHNLEGWSDANKKARFPPIEVCFIQSVHHYRTPDGYPEFDLIGRVIYVGRLEQVKGETSNHENQMTEYRWVKLLDTTSSREILLKLFTNSQPEIISRLSPGDILHATRLICKSIDYNSITKRVLYLRPTIWSQYYIFVETNNEWNVPDEVDWIDSEDMYLVPLYTEVLKMISCVGGYFNLPVPFKTAKQMMDHSSYIPCGIDALSEKAKQLSVGERYRCVVKGSLLQIEFGNNIKLFKGKILSVDLSDDANNWIQRPVTMAVEMNLYPSSPNESIDMSKIFPITVSISGKDNNKTITTYIIPSASDEGCGRFLNEGGFGEWHLRTLVDLFEFALIDETMTESDDKYEIFKSWSYVDLCERLNALKNEQLIFMLDIVRTRADGVVIVLTKIFPWSNELIKRTM
ncbi:6143_t:CDS:10 [Paraglomus occultum]|uniref:6143_t:CDS:1 n=1 Tax=Paraglomus occultum TaxID=144539 RepID=A0A9N9C1K5_9GLOM|nr:6143_t:CDS:10 [Paraglomus occultum]